MTSRTKSAMIHIFPAITSLLAPRFLVSHKVEQMTVFRSELHDLNLCKPPTGDSRMNCAGRIYHIITSAVLFTRTN